MVAGVVGAFVLTSVETAIAQPRLELLAVGDLSAHTALDPRPVGGLSGVVHLEDNRWIAVSDDRRSPRLYTLQITIDLPTQTIVSKVIRVMNLPAQAADAEAIARAPDGDWFIAYESPPSIFHFDTQFHNPVELAPARTIGAELQPNKSWESITLLPTSPPSVLAISELGPASTQTDPIRFRRSRAVLIDPAADDLIARGDFPISPPPGLGPTGLADIEVLGPTSFLALTRSATLRQGYTGVISKIDMKRDAADLSFASTRLASLKELGVEKVGNVEAIALGDALDPSSRLLLIIADNNFARDGQRTTQIIALRLIQ